ncbi:DUF805 domain-containing protein [Vibrio chagasii]|uniref:DUF805 domain-containing protein n=1 Tax=Vibrio chagasii TaxID=170679 RepID=UPI003DA0A13D
MKAYIDFWKNGLDFSGRTCRKDYWMYCLFDFFVLLLTGFFSVFIPFLNVAYVAASLLPNLAVTNRRLHDSGFSGWWQLPRILSSYCAFYLISSLLEDSIVSHTGIYSGNAMYKFGVVFIAVSGCLHFILMTLKGQPETNRYGASPKKLECDLDESQPQVL